MQKKDVGYLIKSINDRLKIKGDAELRLYNLTFAQSRVVAFLIEKGGCAMQKEIEDYLRVSHPTVVGIVSRLEQNGYIISCTDKHDKRNKLVQLTDKAKKISFDMQCQIEKNEQRLLCSLSDEDVEKLKQMLTVIYSNLE